MEATAEPFHAAVFLYRTIAGFYFAWIYQLRGLGVAVGAHAGYNLLIGLLIPSTG
jgi:membrane protease YdiL (CAAX protease family)